MVVSVCREWGYLPITTDDGGIMGAAPCPCLYAAPSLQLLGVVCQVVTEVVTTGRASHRPRAQRRRHTPASSETPPATPQCVRHDVVQERGWVDGVGKSMAAVVGFGTARKTTTIGVCCVLMMKHRCAVSIRSRSGGAPGGIVLLREVVSRGTVPFSGTTSDRVVARERAHTRHLRFLYLG